MSVNIKSNTDGTSGVIQINGNDIVTVNSSGRVGIGTTSPGSKLDVRGADDVAWITSSTTSSGVLMFDSVAAIRIGSRSGAAIIDTGSAERMRIDSAGNVGIGTSSPGAKFDVNGTIRVSAAAGLNNNLDIYSNGQTTNNLTLSQGFGSATDNIGFLYNRANAAFVFGTNNAERMRIDSAGNVGIGTSAPSQRLHLYQAGADVFGVIQADTGKAAQIATRQGNNYTLSGFIANGEVAAMATNAATPLIFSNSEYTERMRIDSAGNVGIGTTSPGSKLTVAGNIEATSGGVLRASRNDTTSEGGQIELGRSTDNATAWTMDVIGATSTPDLRFYNTAGTVALGLTGSNGTLSSLPTYNNTAAGSTVVVTSTGQIRRTSSSIKYKKDVESLDPALATNAINNLRPVWYRTKNPEGDDKATWSHIGLIAEEVHEVEPRLVRYRTAEVVEEQKPVLDEAGEPVLDEEGNPTFTTERVERELAVPEPEDVDYARLSVLLLAEVKELRARVAALEAK